MKKQIYVFDEYVSSQKNGIGSFLAEFLYCMKQIEVDICMLVFNANVKEFTLLEEDDGIKKILFPPFLVGDFTDNAEVVSKFFKLYIPDSPKNVFFVNHSPCEKMLSRIRESHPQSKLIFIIHDLGWTSALTGDVNEFRKIVYQKGSTEENERAKQITDSYNEEKKMYALADRVVCLSNDTLEVLKDIYSVRADKISLIPNGLRDKKDVPSVDNQNELRRKLFISEEDKILLFAGRPTLKKGMHVLLEAFSLVVKEEPNARLVISGFDNNTNFKNIITIASDYASRITFTGLIDKNKLSEWYTAADIGIIPSYYEQCSYVGIEMMMYGLPIVASDGYGLRNMFLDRCNARIAKIGDRKNSEGFVRKLSIVILEILASKEFCHKLSKGAKAVFQSTYNVHNMKENYKKMLESL